MGLFLGDGACVPKSVSSAQPCGFEPMTDRLRDSVAMQEVVGSSPIIRFFFISLE
jgi:hypothetical protein